MAETGNGCGCNSAALIHVAMEQSAKITAAEVFAPGSVAYGFDGSLWIAHANGRDERTPFPAMYPYDPNEEVVTWPKDQLHFITMCGIQFAVIAKTMRQASIEIEVANGWN